MAMIFCPECGKEISSEAAACIYCGRPMASRLTGLSLPNVKNHLFAARIAASVGTAVMVIALFLPWLQFLGFSTSYFGLAHQTLTQWANPKDPFRPDGRFGLYASGNGASHSSSKGFGSLYRGARDLMIRAWLCYGAAGVTFFVALGLFRVFDPKPPRTNENPWTSLACLSVLATLPGVLLYFVAIGEGLPSSLLGTGFFLFILGGLAVFAGGLIGRFAREPRC